MRRCLTEFLGVEFSQGQGPGLGLISPKSCAVVNQNPRLRLALLLIASSVLCVLLARTYFPGQFRDDVAYIAASRAMAENVGYSQLYSPGLNPETTYPVGYPLLLLPFQRWAPQNFELMQAFTAMLGLMSVVALWYSDSRFGKGAATLLALNAFWIESSLSIMSDVPFTLVSLLWLCLLRKCLKLERLAPRHRIGLLVLLTSGVLLRSLGLVMFPITLGALVYRGWKWDGLWVAFVSSVLVLPGLLFSKILGYRDALVAYPGLWVVVSDNAKVYLKLATALLWGEGAPVAQPGNISDLKSVVLWVAVAFFLALMLQGMLKQIREARFAASLYVIFMGAIYLAWPFQFVRFWIPVLPFLYLLILEGAEELTHRLGRTRSHQWLVVALVVAELPALYSGMTRVDISSQVPPSYQWILNETSPTDIVACEESSVWLHTGRRVFPVDPLPAASEPEGWIGSLYAADVRWVILWNRPKSQPLLALTKGLSSHFRQVYSDPVEGVHVFELVGSSKKYLEAVGWVRAGVAFAGEGNFQEMARFLEKSLTLQPWFLRPRLSLAEVWMTLGQPSQAVAVLRDALQMYPNHPSVISTIEWLNLSNSFEPSKPSP